MTAPDPNQELPSKVGRKFSAAALAPNWKTVLAVDASIGALIGVVGYALAIFMNGWIGWPVVALGVLYVAFVGRRALQWRYLRREAGLYE